jgi:hypothetical protein
MVLGGCTPAPCTHFYPFIIIIIIIIYLTKFACRYFLSRVIAINQWNNYLINTHCASANLLFSFVSLHLIDTIMFHGFIAIKICQIPSVTLLLLLFKVPIQAKTSFKLIYLRMIFTLIHYSSSWFFYITTTIMYKKYTEIWKLWERKNQFSLRTDQVLQSHVILCFLYSVYMDILL